MEIFMKKLHIFRKYHSKFISLPLILILLLLFGGVTFFRQEFKQKSDLDNDDHFLKTSEDVSPIFINGSATGLGAHNWSWVEMQPWFDGGNGSWNNPYLIEGITINGGYSSSCFEVVDSNKYFTLQDCTFAYSGPSPQAGLKMSNVNNSYIILNIIHWNDGNGIYLDSCNNINFSTNDIKANEGNGVFLQNVRYVIIESSTIENNILNGLYFENTDEVTLLENYIEKNVRCGCFFELVNYINLIRNEIKGNSLEGLLLQLINNSYLLDNNVAFNNYVGLDITGINNDIINNSFNYNYGNGVACHWYSLFDSCHNNTFRNNEINGNYQSGMKLQVSADNIIIENSMSNNGYVGLFLEYGDNNNITNNIVNNNEGNWGIYISDSDNNRIIENQIIGNIGTIEFGGSCSGNVVLNNIYEILQNLFIEISEEFLTSEAFNLTLFMCDENNVGIIVDSIQMWWNGTDVSSSVQTLGAGFYFISLTPITVVPGEDPILLNMTVSVDGYEMKSFEINLAVDPETLEKNGTQNFPQPMIPGYNLIVLIMVLLFISVVFIRKKFI
ncbi:MAG: hypothetical protein EU547_07140 [Promethearchaeota archaeon]|nr:MAG: hypothetical protein EU547_07140 [Candidatus Lokiarchaeota archaeon]